MFFQEFGGSRVSQPLRRPKDRISVLVVTADNMTSELLKNAFAHGREGFKVETLTGSSEKIIGELGAHKADVALISDELQDGPEAGSKVLQKTPTLTARLRSCSWGIANQSEW
jgi:hypothetical protein